MWPLGLMVLFRERMSLIWRNCIALASLSHPPCPGTQRPQADPIQYATGKERLPVTTIVPEKSAVDARKDNNERLERAPNERALAVATWVLAFATLFLFVAAVGQVFSFYWQLTLIGRSLRDAKKTAIAAQDAASAAGMNARALMSAERARFHIVVHTHNLDRFIRAATFYPNSGGMRMSGDVDITYFFKNYGKAPGLILEMSHYMALSERPPDPIYQVIRQVPREYMVAGGKETEHQTCAVTLPVLSVSEAMEIQTGRKTIWFAGRFDYQDFVTGEPQVHRFYLRYIRTESSGIWRFQSIDYEHYNTST